MDDAIQDELKLTNYISVGIMYDNVVTIVNGQIINQCKKAICSVPWDVNIKSVDELLEKYSIDMDDPKQYNEYDISLQDELFVHASNIQGWIENGYDMRFIDSRLGFPILQALREIEDRFKEIYNEEIKRRWEAGTDKYRAFLCLQGKVNLEKIARNQGNLAR